jgi:hypothetical protein
VAHAVIPATSRSLKWEDRGPGWPGQTVRPYLQNNSSKKGHRYRSSSRVPALQVRCPEFKPQYCQKKKKKKQVYFSEGCDFLLQTVSEKKSHLFKSQIICAYYVSFYSDSDLINKNISVHFIAKL